MGKFGFTAKEVWQMSHLEVSAWIGSYLQSQGIKPNKSTGNTTHYNIQRKPKGGT